MTVKTGSAWAGIFNTVDATGALTAATGTPVGAVYIDGVADDAEVTITGSNPYKWAVTLPVLTAGQRVNMYITATITGITTGNVVASEQADTVLTSDVKAETVLILEDTDTTLPALIAAIQVWASQAIHASYAAGLIRDIRGSSWSIPMPDLTLDANKQQFSIKRNAQDLDEDAILFVDSKIGLITLNGVSTGLTAGDASLVYAGTTLTLTVKTGATAQLPVGTFHYGIQSVTAAGVVEENYGGTFTITADIVRATA